ncbi:hypothetical protein Zmor_018568 [Zophobas morio]|uniref:Uncharacterized protein n=1 Tax=Zophobas morio TaxID=2755281 RepID=A0AA38I7K6_9CUCU|nr:hypothetical protein Zmor_018568 [Zophobas morio]
MKFLVIDMQGFCIPEFIPKEMTFTDGRYVAHYWIKSLKPFKDLDPKIKKHIRWFENNHHHLRYNDGIVDSNEVPNILYKHIIQDQVDTIYVKGHIKRHFLQFNLGQYNGIRLINLENTLDVPHLLQCIPYNCTHHINGQKTACVCSYENCKTIYNWLIGKLP